MSDKEEDYEINREHNEDTDGVCPTCNRELRLEEISSDADGNRKEFGLVCGVCD